MNFLAHAYLSFHHPDILVGNMISDFVKGKKKFDYCGPIQKGIQLHRSIDEFTDTHATTKKAMSVFHSAYRLYSAAFVDVTFDHFLANDETIFNEQSLNEFSWFVYKTLNNYASSLPENFLVMLPYMETNNWLFNYRLHYGMERSYGGIVRRAAYLTESDTAYKIFNAHYNFLRECYEDFFPQLLQYAKNEFDKLLHTV